MTKPHGIIMDIFIWVQLYHATLPLIYGTDNMALTAILWYPHSMPKETF